jgi:hypothetical protein
VGNYCTGAQFFCKLIDDSALDDSPYREKYSIDNKTKTQPPPHPPPHKKERTDLFLEQYNTVQFIFLLMNNTLWPISRLVQEGQRQYGFFGCLNKPQFCILDGKIYHYTVCVSK